MTVEAIEAALLAGLDTGDLDLDGVVVRVMPPWMANVLGSGVSAITLENHIFVKADRYETVVLGKDPVLLSHELVHVGQWRREGRAGFLFRYLSDYIRNRMIGLDHDIAYRAIGFEAAAFESSERDEM